MIARGVLAGVMLALAVSPVRAQSPLGIRGYFTAGAITLASGETFKAVAGQDHATSLGGGGQVSGLWKGLFVDAALSQQMLDGQRVFILNRTVFPLGIPLEVRFRPVDVAFGWRFEGRRVSPYAGAGLSSIAYRETSDFAEAGDNVDGRRTGALLLAGLDVPVWKRWVHAGGEIRYRAVTGVLGDSGVSAIYDEDQLGAAYAVRSALTRRADRPLVACPR